MMQRLTLSQPAFCPPTAKSRAARRRSVMAPRALVVPSEAYGYVLGSVALTAAAVQFLAVKVAVARKEAGVQYPAMYTDATDEASTRFNCVQRSHQNTLEYLPSVLVLQALMGLKFPITAAALGVAWTVGRLIYAAGYSTGDPAKRGPGSAIAGVVFLALIGGCGFAGIEMLQFLG